MAGQCAGGGGLRTGLEPADRGGGEPAEPARQPGLVQRAAERGSGGGLPGDGELGVPGAVPAAGAVHQHAGRELAQVEAVEVERAAQLGKGGVQQVTAVVEPESVLLAGGHPATDPVGGLQDLNGEAVAGERAGGGQARESGADHDDVRVGRPAGAAGEVVRGHWGAPSLVPGLRPTQAAGCRDTVRGG